ncbi:pyridoxal-phosphate dependent enzyme [Frankia sp. AgPm24]|nr:pyridoxal-phosphate dependent enzyme [Frankia sp. AgPm24]MCK9920827.1 pyridoxal-phosphate dependent enzyme [Frankia sp. AgPm24]
MGALGGPGVAGLGVRVPSPVERLVDSRLSGYGVEVFLKRDDLIHPEVPGNKWRKLGLNLRAVLDQGHETIVTFGGAYSNHIRAVAAAGRALGIATVGLIRGEEHLPLNPSLAAARRDGMDLHYVDRGVYRHRASAEFLGSLPARFGRFYLIPEGGSNDLGVRGCVQIAAEIGTSYDVVVCPCGTGGTLAGLSHGLAPAAGTRAVGIAALKGADFLRDEVRRLQHAAFGGVSENWSIELGYHGGGFAKTSPELLAFAAEFERLHGLAVERVYVAKMLAAVMDMVRNGRFVGGQSVLVVVTG